MKEYTLEITNVVRMLLPWFLETARRPIPNSWSLKKGKNSSIWFRIVIEDKSTTLRVLVPQNQIIVLSSDVW